MTIWDILYGVGSIIFLFGLWNIIQVRRKDRKLIEFMGDPNMGEYETEKEMNRRKRNE